MASRKSARRAPFKHNSLNEKKRNEKYAAEFVKCFAVVILPPDFNEWIVFMNGSRFCALFSLRFRSNIVECAQNCVFHFLSFCCAVTLCCADNVQIVRHCIRCDLWMLRITRVFFVFQFLSSDWMKLNEITKMEAIYLFLLLRLYLCALSHIYLLNIFFSSASTEWYFWYARCSL